ncbi:zinc finger BED domain-containing protein RICESLEEPER 2-like protein [Tanacetum coccineum]
MSLRDITREGYSIHTCVADLIVNGAWNWPFSWLAKAPNLGLVPTPTLTASSQDRRKWRDTNGTMTDFTVKCAWEALRPRGNEAPWFHIVWFTHAIPRHTFRLCLIMRRSLKTQDKLRQWDVDPATDLTQNRCHQFPAENWVIIEGLTQLLEVFNNATKVLSGVYYPTSPLVLQQIVFMTTKLTEYEFEGAALNPCFNVHGVEFLIESISTDLELFDDSYATKAKKWFNDSFEEVTGNKRITLLRWLKDHKNKKARSDPSLSSEYERYVHSDFVTMLQTTEFETFNVLGFWKAKETMFPVLSRMAMDILSVQATLVASESAFSTSGWVLSIRRTRLTPASLEMCMCLKDHLDAQERKQDKSTLETPEYFEEEVLDAEVQTNEAILLFDEKIALDAASSEGSMSGPGSGGEEAEAEPNYGYDVYNDDY